MERTKLTVHQFLAIKEKINVSLNLLAGLTQAIEEDKMRKDSKLHYVNSITRDLKDIKQLLDTGLV